VTGKENKNIRKPASNYKHLKWPSIIMAVLIFLLIVAIDYCSRRGEI